MTRLFTYIKNAIYGGSYEYRLIKETNTTFLDDTFSHRDAYEVIQTWQDQCYCFGVRLCKGGYDALGIPEERDHQSEDKEAWIFYQYELQRRREGCTHFAKWVSLGYFKHPLDV